MSVTATLNSFTSYSFAASVTVLLYDILLLLPTEIDYVWLPRPIHRHLLLFALNRYLPLVDTVTTINWLLHKPTPAQCRQFAFIAGPLMALGIVTSQAILMIRTYAIWDRSRAVFWCFIGTGIFCFIPGIVGLAIELKTIQFIELPSNHPGCMAVFSNMARLFFIPVLVSETIIASLTFFKGVQHLRHSSHPFLIEFYVSGMFFYACLLLMTLANILVPMWAYGFTPSFLASFQRTFHSILSSRIMLLIVKQRRIRRHRPTEELYTDDTELSHSTQYSSKTFVHYLGPQRLYIKLLRARNLVHCRRSSASDLVSHWPVLPRYAANVCLRSVWCIVPWSGQGENAPTSLDAAKKVPGPCLKSGKYHHLVGFLSLSLLCSWVRRRFPFVAFLLYSRMAATCRILVSHTEMNAPTFGVLVMGTDRKYFMASENLGLAS
ncbi:hypothetical protein DFS33DRAFT_1456702 [Desarmillaria ectypa]|nr:hypothetical protein DFS33DRAFT_1456702 [Desarmillaria ectypa]